MFDLEIKWIHVHIIVINENEIWQYPASKRRTGYFTASEQKLLRLTSLAVTYDKCKLGMPNADDVRPFSHLLKGSQSLNQDGRGTSAHCRNSWNGEWQHLHVAREFHLLFVCDQRVAHEHSHCDWPHPTWYRCNKAGLLGHTFKIYISYKLCLAMLS